MDIVINANTLEAFKKQLVSVNKKLAKFGAEPVTVEYSMEAIKTLEGYIEGVRCSLSIPEFHHTGKMVLGRIDHESDIVQTNDGTINETVEKYRYNTTCDHCGKKRHRTLTYVIDTEEGVKHIGSTCVNDFFGINALSILSAYEKFTSTVSEFEDDEYMKFGRQVYPAELVLQTAYNIICDKGYKAKKDSPYDNTSIWIEEAINTAKTGYNEEVHIREDIVEYIKGISNTGEFTNNLIHMIGSDWFNEKQFGYIAYAVKMWMERKDNTKQGKELADGGKYEEEVVVVSKSQYVDPYGLYGMSKNVYTFDTTDGNRLVWFTTSAIFDKAGYLVEPNAEQTIKVKFVVKKYNSDRDCYYVKNVKVVG